MQQAKEHTYQIEESDPGLWRKAIIQVSESIWTIINNKPHNTGSVDSEHVFKDKLLQRKDICLFCSDKRANRDVPQTSKYNMGQESKYYCFYLPINCCDILYTSCSPFVLCSALRSSGVFLRSYFLSDYCLLLS